MKDFSLWISLRLYRIIGSKALGQVRQNYVCQVREFVTILLDIIKRASPDSIIGCDKVYILQRKALYVHCEKVRIPEMALAEIHCLFSQSWGGIWTLLQYIIWTFSFLFLTENLDKFTAVLWMQLRL